MCSINSLCIPRLDGGEGRIHTSLTPALNDDAGILDNVCLCIWIILHMANSCLWQQAEIEFKKSGEEHTILNSI